MRRRGLKNLMNPREKHWDNRKDINRSIRWMKLKELHIKVSTISPDINRCRSQTPYIGSENRSRTPCTETTSRIKSIASTRIGAGVRLHASMWNDQRWQRMQESDSPQTTGATAGNGRGEGWTGLIGFVYIQWLRHGHGLFSSFIIPSFNIIRPHHSIASLTCDSRPTTHL